MGYINQVAEAVRDAIHEYNEVDLHGVINLEAIIAGVPKPDPVAWVADSGRVEMEHAAKRGAFKTGLIIATRNEPPFVHAIYTYPPDAQAEIDRLNVELTHQTRLAEIASNMASEREAFIEALLSSRHEELMAVATLVDEALTLFFNGEAVMPDLKDIVAKVEQGRAL